MKRKVVLMELIPSDYDGVNEFIMYRTDLGIVRDLNNKDKGMFVIEESDDGISFKDHCDYFSKLVKSKCFVIEDNDFLDVVSLIPPDVFPYRKVANFKITDVRTEKILNLITGFEIEKIKCIANQEQLEEFNKTLKDLSDSGHEFKGDICIVNAGDSNIRPSFTQRVAGRVKKAINFVCGD